MTRPKKGFYLSTLSLDPQLVWKGEDEMVVALSEMNEGIVKEIIELKPKSVLLLINCLPAMTS